MSSGTIYNESKLFECQAVQFTMKVNFLNVKVQFTMKIKMSSGTISMKVNFLNVKRYNLQWK